MNALPQLDASCEAIDRELRATSDEGLLHTLDHIAAEIDRRWPGRRLILYSMLDVLLGDSDQTAKPN